MVNDYLTQDELKLVMTAGMADGLSSGIEKEAFGVTDAKELVTTPIELALWLGGLGLASGTANGILYNITKNRMTAESAEKEEEINKKLSLYNAKNRELEDAKWMGKVRSKRDNLVRNMKKMTPEEYEAAYNEISNALNERVGA